MKLRTRHVVAIVALAAGVVALCVWALRRNAPAIVGPEKGEPPKEPPGGALPSPSPQVVFCAEEQAHLNVAGGTRPTWAYGPFPTLEERTQNTLVIHRLNEKGELRKLGEHALDPDEVVYVTPGVGDCYALFVTKSDFSVASHVFCRGRRECTLTGRLATWDGREVGVAAVLAGGSLYVVYAPRGRRHGPPPGTKVTIVAALLCREGATYRRQELYRGPERRLRVDFSTNGEVLAIYDGRDGHTRVYSATDGRRAIFEGFRVTAVAHDGATLVGTRDESIVVYRNGRLVAERDWGGRPPHVYLAASGASAAVRRSPTSVEVLDTSSLRTSYVAAVPPGFGRFTSYVPSSSGRLVTLAEKRLPNPPDATRNKLYRMDVRHPDGSIAFTREFPPSTSEPLAATAWSLDGNTLYYTVREDNRLMRLRFQ